MREVETTLAVPDAFAVPDLLSVPGVVSRSLLHWSLRAQYWDTDDQVLARQGVTLRRRTGEGEPTWTAKLPTSSGRGRWEVDVASRTARPPARLLELVRPWADARPLRPVVEVRTERTSSLLVSADGDALAEVADDRVSTSGGTGESWREVEVEVLGSAEVAEAAVDTLCRAGARPSQQPSKARRALGVLEERAPEVRPKDPAGLLVVAVLTEGRRAVLLRDGETRLEQPDAVHQLRVACRRLRSQLQALAPLLDDPRAGAVREELQWLAGELSAARDLEVLRERVGRTAAHPVDPLDVSALDLVLAEQEAEALARGHRALASARYQRLLATLHDLQRAPVLAPGAAASCREALPPLLDRAQRRLAKAVDRLDPVGADDSWHQARKAAKRARYVSETVAPVVQKGRRDGKRAQRLQQLLGEHTDAVLASVHLLELAGRRPELAVLCARLAERERATATAVREQVLAGR